MTAVSRRRPAPSEEARGSGAPPAAAPRRPGSLVVVATPIGNLEDLSPRARAALAAADLVACEDTRRTGLLLHRLGVRRPLLSLHAHNERRRVDRVLEAVAAGGTVALVSDAGTPLLSDPGYPVVRAAAAAGLPVVAIPGPSALLAALVASGLPPYPFTFGGFPPARSGPRRRFFARFSDLGHTLVFYEAPQRLAASLADALEALGERPAAVGRELTKLHEEVLRGTLGELVAALAERPKVKGECTVVVGAAPPSGGRSPEAAGGASPGDGSPGTRG